MTLAVASVVAVAVAIVVIVNVVIVSRDQGIGDGGRATSAKVSPTDVAVDSAGNLYIADAGERVRKVTPEGVISTIVGDDALANNDVSVDSVTIDGDGSALFNDGGRLRRVVADGTITTVAGVGKFCSGRNGQTRRSATASEVCPSDVVVDAAGNSYFVDLSTGSPSHIRRVNKDGDMSTLDLPERRPGCLDGAPGLVDPYALAVDNAGNLYVADYAACQVLKVDAAGTVTVVAGSGQRGFSGDGGPAVDASLIPNALAVDLQGNLYIADFAGNRVRRVSPDGIISTVAGNGSNKFSGDGGQAVAAGMEPAGIAVDRAGNLYIADRNNRVRRVSPDGMVSTVAGDGSFQKSPYTND